MNRAPRRLAVICCLVLLFSGVGQADDNPDSGYVFDVTVKTAEELSVILDRAEGLRGTINPSQHGRIAIVLHGDELALFEKRNYASNQSLVERARQLDQDAIIDIMACQSMMQTLKIEQNQLPSFIEQVPFAPDEIRRLERELGFTRL